jgi:hypothetical protein
MLHKNFLLLFNIPFHNKTVLPLYIFSFLRRDLFFMSDFGIPQSLSISDVKRNAMAAFRRTVIHGDTSQNAYSAGELIYLPLATGTAGAFWDISTARLEMTVEIYNPNYFVDFINLPRCGFNTVIEECGLEFHNSLHENQRFYAEMIESEMIRRGENSIPYEMTVSNPHDVGGGLAGDLHINLIKPSMVTTAGLPHGVRYPILKQPNASNNSSSVTDVLTQGILLNGNPYLKKPLGRNGWDTITTEDNFYSKLTAGPTLTRTADDSIQHRFHEFAETAFPSNSIFDDRVTLPTQSKYAIYNLDIGTNRTLIQTAEAGTAASDRQYADITTTGANRTTGIYGGSSHGADLFPALPNRFKGPPAVAGQYSKSVPRLQAFGNRRADNTIWDVFPGQTVGGYTPMMWPAKQPCPMDKLQKQIRDARRGVNTKNVQNYYANCKNISVGIPVTITDDAGYGKELWGGDPTKEGTLPLKSHTRGERYSFRVSMKFYSCILGVFAQKWFPSLLIGAGKARIRMKLQQPNVAFQTLMDPCRIIPRTARDRFPYLGCFKSTSTLSDYSSNPLENLAHAIHPILISDYIPGSCFNDMVALGKFPIPSLKTKAMNRITDVISTLTQQVSTSIFGPTGGVAVNSSYAPYAANDARKVMGYLALGDPEQNVADVQIPVPENVTRACGYAAADTAADIAKSGLISAGLVTRALQNVAIELSRNMMFGFPPMILQDQTNNPIVLLGDEDHTSRKGVQKNRNVIEAKVDNVTKASSIKSVNNYHWFTDYTPFFIPNNYAATEAWGVGKRSRQTVWKQGVSDATDTVAAQTKFRPNLTDVENEERLDYEEKGLWWDMYQFPTPQYVPMKKPWDKKSDRKYAMEDIVNESEMCYGTYLPRSVAQVRRTNRQLFSLSNDYESYPGISDRLTYSVMNVAFRCEEVILPEPASALIISSVMEGGITIEAETIKSIEQILQKQDNQKILLNVSAGLINDICFVFQPTEMYSGDKAYGYNSYAFYCPFTSFKFVKQSTDTKTPTGTAIDRLKIPNSSADYNDLGGEPEFYNSLSYGDHIGIRTYLTISTEFFPRIPINDLQTLIDHVCWGDQRRGDVEYLGLEPMLQNAYDTSNYQRVVPFQDGFFSVFTPIETLDDQTMTGNPYWAPLEMNINRTIRGRRSKHPALPYFKPFDGTFHLALNLQPFMGQHDRMNVGSPMVNTNAYLHMENCHMIREHETRMITFIRCFARVVIERGGILQIFT